MKYRNELKTCADAVDFLQELQVRILLIVVFLLAGCTVEPTHNMRIDFVCVVHRDPAHNGHIDHMRCDKHQPIQFTWKF